MEMTVKNGSPEPKFWCVTVYTKSGRMVAEPKFFSFGPFDKKFIMDSRYMSLPWTHYDDPYVSIWPFESEGEAMEAGRQYLKSHPWRSGIHDAAREGTAEAARDSGGR
jgi:hypothetical protein